MSFETFRLMMDAGNYLPAHIRPWLMWMQFTLMLLPFVFIRYRAAQALILAQIANIAVAFVIFNLEGNQVTRLFGLGHAFWIIPLCMFYRDLSAHKWRVYRVYAGVAALTICVSLIFDVVDVARWISGDRGTTLIGAPAPS